MAPLNLRYVFLILMQLNYYSSNEIAKKENAKVGIQYSTTRIRELACSLPAKLVCLKSLAVIKRKVDLSMEGKRHRTTEERKTYRVNYTELLHANGDMCEQTFSKKSKYNDEIGNFMRLFDDREVSFSENIYIDMDHIQSRFLCRSTPTTHGKRGEVNINRYKRIERDINESGDTVCLSYWRGDGFCDLGCNTKMYDYDDGDCCYATCIAKVRRYPCGYTGFQCRKESDRKPHWLNNISLCFKWRSTGDAKQCNSKPRGKMCAPVGSMTRFYSDETDKRTGGCKLSWMIEAKSIPLWFKRDLKICFSNYADGDGWQCNNGYTNTERCVRVNRWLNYIDNTDDRRGGCYMSWKLQYLGIIPSWAKTLKLCFYWVSFNNQCNMNGESNYHCAALNHWTKNYRDDTDKRKDGCEMAWGILT